MWSRAWDYLRDEANFRVVAGIGGGLAVVIGAIWTVFVWFRPSASEKPSAPQKQIEADCGSVAIGGDVSGATITAGSSNNCPKPGR